MISNAVYIKSNNSSAFKISKQNIVIATIWSIVVMWGDCDSTLLKKLKMLRFAWSESGIKLPVGVKINNNCTFKNANLERYTSDF